VAQKVSNYHIIKKTINWIDSCLWTEIYSSN